MSNHKDRWLIVLLCVNVFLITAIVISQVGLPKAYAQVRPYDYMLIPGKIQTDTEVVWIIDMGNRQLTSCIYNKQNNRIEFGQIIDISPRMEFFFNRP